VSHATASPSDSQSDNEETDATGGFGERGFCDGAPEATSATGLPDASTRIGDRSGAEVVVQVRRAASVMAADASASVGA
jgi:hypothetical protein